MEPRLITLLVILILVAAGAVATRAWRPQGPTRGLGPVLAVRLAAVLAVTALVAAARIAGGPEAAAATGVVAVLVVIVVLVLTGYARIPPIPRTHR